MKEVNTTDSMTTPEVDSGTEETETVEATETENKPQGNGQPPAEAGNVQQSKQKKAKKTPAWKNAQQKNTEPKNNDDRANERSKNSDRVSIKMRTDYRDVAKAGKVWETDREKAAELVRLGRADYV